MKPITAILTYSKSTKNKHVFSHPDIGGFYLLKDQVGTPVPQTLKATFEVVDEGTAIPNSGEEM